MPNRHLPRTPGDEPHIAPGVSHVSGTVDPSGAKRARAAASASLVDAIEMGVDVRNVSASLRQLREANHFAELLTESMERRRRE